MAFPPITPSEVSGLHLGEHSRLFTIQIPHRNVRKIVCESIALRSELPLNLWAPGIRANIQALVSRDCVSVKYGVKIHSGGFLHISPKWQISLFAEWGIYLFTPKKKFRGRRFP